MEQLLDSFQTINTAASLPNCCPGAVQLLKLSSIIAIASGREEWIYSVTLCA